MMEPEEPPPPPQPTDLSQTAAAPTGWRRGPSGRAAAESSRPLQEGQAEGRGSTLHRPAAAAAAAASPQSRLAPCEARGREGTQGGVGGSQGRRRRRRHRRRRSPTRRVREPLARCGASPGASLPASGVRACVRVRERATARAFLVSFPPPPPPPLSLLLLGGGERGRSGFDGHLEEPGGGGTEFRVLGLWKDAVSKQAFSLLRFRVLEENPICSAGGILLRASRHYKTKPTHGIGRYKHLVKVLEPKKKKAKVEVRAINLGTDYEYGVLNIHLIAYDMTLAESYAQYVHRLCNRLSIQVEESYAMPTKTMEVMRLPAQGNKMVLDSVLTTHERVVQISGLSATFAEIFLEILQSNLPEGVRLSVREHTEEDFKGRFKARPELEELLAKLN
ncbi:large ribosomal subunit protein mL48 [Peromyscus maniculatus bairdii]|uniref:large ribosomal subunit protein mL48 n=1 Tax=Peromyscus maniculatus bairdii TaxID=230844 RepID=UPI003FD4877A